jgi:hypothetical protein
MNALATIPIRARNMSVPRAHTHDIRATALLLKANDVVGVGSPKPRAGICAGYFDDPVTMAAAIRRQHTKARNGVPFMLVIQSRYTELVK